MKKSNNQQKKEDWFKKLDNPLKSIKVQYAKLFLKKKEISKNQKILNEYNSLSKFKKNNSPLDEKDLLKRINVYNYKNLTKENIIMKNILSKIQERNSRKKNRNSRVRLKRFKTNNEYEPINDSPKKNKNISQNINKLKLQKINKNYSLNSHSPSITDRKKEKNELKLILSKKPDINIDNINSENNKNIYYYRQNISNNKIEEEFTNNFFKTLTRVDKYKYKSNKSNKIYNLYDKMKILKDEEEFGQELNKNILCLKKNRRNSNSLNVNKIRKINLSINYSKIRNKNEEIKRLNNQRNHIFEYLNKNINQLSQKKFITINNKDEDNKKEFESSVINKKHNLLLPILTNKP